MSDLNYGPLHEMEPIPHIHLLTKKRSLESPETLGKTKHYCCKQTNKIVIIK